ncbi:hypothetical protein AT01_961 [Yersinia aldovae 670-83]|nr:hypothetical protein AT01_961 [Yersinia aldovae 670-83]
MMNNFVITPYPVDFEMQESGKEYHPDELTLVSDSGDKSVRN